MPIQQLVAVNHASEEYNEGAQQHLYYAESWLLVHYLLRGADFDPMSRLMQVLKPGLGGEIDFPAVFGMDKAKLELALRQYALANRFESRLLRMEVNDGLAAIRFQPVTETERDTALENLRWRVRPEEFCPLKLLELAERDPKASAPYEVLAAYTWLKEANRRKAVSFWEKAVERGSTSAYAYVQLAKAQLRPLIGSSSLDYRAPAVVADPIRKYLDRALELNPGCQEAWEALAQIEAFAENPRTAVVDEVQSRLPAFRSKAGTLVALAILQWRSGNLVTSRQILEELGGLGHPRAEVQRLMRRLHERLETPEWAKTASSADFADRNATNSM